MLWCEQSSLQRPQCIDQRSVRSIVVSSEATVSVSHKSFLFTLTAFRKCHCALFKCNIHLRGTYFLDINKNQDFIKCCLLRGAVPGWLSWLCRTLGFSKVREVVGSSPALGFALSAESASDYLSLSLPLSSSPCSCTCTLSLEIDTN